MASANNPEWIKIQGNFGGTGNPTENTYHALDDIEVWDGMPSASVCDDGSCDSGETCFADSCCNGQLYDTATQICCYGIIYTGDCCSDTDCTSPDTCVSNVCTSPTYECSDSLDNDGDGQTDYPNDNVCIDSIDNDETNCGDSACEGGETCSSCPSDCGTCTQTCAD